MNNGNALAKLQAENARLIALLEAHGIEWQLPVEPVESALLPTNNEPSPVLSVGAD